MKAFFTVLALIAVSSIAQAQMHRPPPGVGSGGPMIHPPAPQLVTPSQIAYNSLTVREVNITPPRFAGSTTFSKRVGGLECKNVRPVGPFGRLGSYECRLDQRRQNPAAIYAAMNVPAQRDRRPIGGFVVDYKEAGNLTCRESRPLRPRLEARYSCELR